MPFRFRNFRKFWPLFLLGLAVGFVRLSKGAVVLDAYAFLSRPFWPGPAQRDWVKSGFQLETQARLRLLEQDNQRLRALLLLDQASDVGYISAAVIARSTSGWWQQLELGKGGLNGIQQGHPVLGPGGLLGMIHSTTPTTARVRLLTSPRSQIGVWVPRTQRHGILTGMGTSRPQLVFLDNDPKVFPGDLVSTSPASTKLPPNVPVGIIQSFDDLARLEPKAVVQLIASPEAIDWVQIKIR